MKQLLLDLNACSDAREWAQNKSWQEIYQNCYRGDWLLWLYKKTNKGDLKLLTLVKGHCANTVRHLMKSEASKKAVDAAINFGNGLIQRSELDAAYADADAYAAAAYADADAYAAVANAAADVYAAYAADAAADVYAADDADADADVDADVAAAYVAYVAAYAADAAAADADYSGADSGAAKKENQLLTANIVRKYIPIELWNIYETGNLINQ